MKLRKHITVANKIATYDKQKEGIIVCGNSNYEIEFTFDSEWDEYPTKKARFSVWRNDEYHHINVEFTGTICPIPPLYDTTLVEVGVFIDNGIRTTTAAEIKCRKCALCRASKSMLTPEQVASFNEALGVGIESVEQTTTSTEDCGDNVITITMTDKTRSTFVVKNGSKGSPGNAGAQGPIGPPGHTPQKGIDYLTPEETEQYKQQLSKDFVTQTVVYKADGSVMNITLMLKDLTASEREIILSGCLINYYNR